MPVQLMPNRVGAPLPGLTAWRLARRYGSYFQQANWNVTREHEPGLKRTRCEVRLLADAVDALKPWERDVIALAALSIRVHADDADLLRKANRGEALTPHEARRVRRSRVETGAMPSGEESSVAAAYARIIESLIATHQLTLQPACHWRTACASAAHRIVWLWFPIHTAESFATALHEIKHAITAEPMTAIKGEIDAWQWAVRTARELAPNGWTDAMQRELTDSLSSFFPRATERERDDITRAIAATRH